MPNPTVAKLKAISNAIAHFQVDTVSGFGSQAGNGSAQITGLSAAVDIPIAVFKGLSGAGGLTNAYTFSKITTGSVNFIADRIRIQNTSTSTDRLQVFWFNEK